MVCIPYKDGNDWGMVEFVVLPTYCLEMVLLANKKKFGGIQQSTMGIYQQPYQSTVGLGFGFNFIDYPTKLRITTVMGRIWKDYISQIPWHA